MIVFAALALLCGFLFWRMPGSFLPEEDQGYAFGLVQLPAGLLNGAGMFSHPLPGVGLLPKPAKNIPDRITPGIEIGSVTRKNVCVAEE